MLPRVCNASAVRIRGKYCRRVRGIRRKYLQSEPRYPPKKRQTIERPILSSSTSPSEALSMNMRYRARRSVVIEYVAIIAFSVESLSDEQGCESIADAHQAQ
jgi:hypothetical protein